MPTRTCDILIQAGHENTPDGATGGEGPLGNEIDWTPIVANEAVALLRSHGVDAVKEDASIKHSDRLYQCRLAVFVHFDDPDAGESGPSVGYSHDSDRPAATEWKALYSQYWPFNETWHSDNYTNDEHFYYGFGYTITTDAEFLIELGDLGSLRQAQWMKPRLRWIGQLLAHFLSRRSGLGSVPLPPPFNDDDGPLDPLKFVLHSRILSAHQSLENVATRQAVLRKTGGKVDGIAFVQDALNALAANGDPEFAVAAGAYRGYFGEKTETALLAYQGARGLGVDGAVGSETILALDADLVALEAGSNLAPTPVGNPKPGGPPLAPAAGATPTGTPAAFATNPSKGTFNGNSSKTTGLSGSSQAYSDGTIVRAAIETLTAVRNGQALGPKRANWKQVRQGKAMTVEQPDYAWGARALPHAILMEDSDGIANKAPAGFTATKTENRKSTQFGKFDSIDEGTGSEVFGVTQTNSDVFGASVKRSRLIAVFGQNFDSNPKRLDAMVEIYLPEKRRYACVPLVDVGPGEAQPAHIDLTFALDRFLGTEGEKDVDFRIIVPV
jgi:peptidoglycan hydrolase-like protein with peptidoglycan-binding domain